MPWSGVWTATLAWRCVSRRRTRAAPRRHPRHRHAGAIAGRTGDAHLGEDLAARLPPAEGLYILAAAKSGEQSRPPWVWFFNVLLPLNRDGVRSDHVFIFGAEAVF